MNTNNYWNHSAIINEYTIYMKIDRDTLHDGSPMIYLKSIPLYIYILVHKFCSYEVLKIAWCAFIENDVIQ